MKALLLALTIITPPTAFGASPTIQVVKRIETPAAFAGPALVQEKDGSTTLVQVERIAGEPQLMRLVAYGAEGRALAETKVWPPAEGENLRIDSADRNAAGELVVLTSYNRDSGTTGRLYSENLTRQTSAILGQGSFPRLLDRIRVGNKNLALVSLDLGRGPQDQSTTLVRMMDEDTAKVFSQTVLNQSVSAKLGVNKSNQVVAILLGRETLALLDTQSGKVTSILSEEQLASRYTDGLKLSVGEFISLNGSTSMKLLRVAPLFNGEVREERTFAPQTYFLGDVSVERKEKGLMISALRSGAQLGFIADSAEGENAQVHVDSVTKTPLGLIAITSQAKEKHSFQPGTILQYVNLENGAELRKSERPRQSMSGQIFVKGGRTYSLEVRELSGLANTYELVDLALNEVVSRGKELLNVVGFQAESGRIVGLRANDKNQVCVADLQNDFDEPGCVADSMVQADQIRYGAGVTAIAQGSGKIRLPLTSGDQNHSESRGFLDLLVKN